LYKHITVTLNSAVTRVVLVTRVHISTHIDPHTPQLVASHSHHTY